ncbi:MFS transporter [Zavarzinia sp.]|uniref:MFS transporter n=1 Tax=Zavarzinia sp. TaxID=2027920 RepID=UPI003561D65B
MTAEAAPLPLRSLAGVIACICIVGMTFSLSLPLLSLLLEAQGVASWLIGVNAATTGVATLAAAPLVPGLVRRFGVMPFLIGCILLSAASLIAFPLWPTLGAWFLLRFTMNIAVTGLFVVSESWISHLAGSARRGRVMGLYATALAAGFMFGPVLLQATGIEGIAPFAATALATLAAALPLAAARRDLPPFEEPPRASLATVARSAPAVVAVALLYGAVESGVLSLLPVWGVQNGLGELAAARLTVWVGAGNVLLPLPIGIAADRLGRRAVMLACAAAAGLAALGLPAALGGPLLGPLLIVLGGSLLGLYTAGLTDLGHRFAGADLATANAAYVVFYGIGAVTGPPLAGGAHGLAGTVGLPLTMALGCAAFLAGVFFARKPPR